MDDSLRQQLKLVGYKGRFDLSSLIEACGEGFGELRRTLIGFQAIEFIPKDSEYVIEWYFIGEGTTPEEAVAKLYLQLQRDKVNGDGKQKTKDKKNM